MIRSISTFTKNENGYREIAIELEKTLFQSLFKKPAKKIIAEQRDGGLVS